MAEKNGESAVFKKTQHFMFYVKSFGASAGVLAIVMAFIYNGWFAPKVENQINAATTPLYEEIETLKLLIEEKNQYTNDRMDRHKQQQTDYVHREFEIHDELAKLKYADKEEFLILREKIKNK